MVEKLLHEADWKDLAAALAVKGTALTNALGLLRRADAQGPQQVLDALEVVEKHLDEQAKESKAANAEKSLRTQLKDMQQALERQRKAATSELKAAQQAAEEKAEAEADEEDETPALLTSKMAPLVRDLRKANGKLRMHAMVCTAGKATAVLIMRRAISSSRRKLLAEAVDAKGGMKYIVGECLFEDGALTLVVASPAAGLAKRVRQAFLDQTKLRLKVKVRGEGGAEEHDGEDAGEDQEGVKPVSQVPDAPTPPTPEQAAYTKLLREVQAPLEAALGKRHPESTKLRALIGMASEKAERKKDYAGAVQALRLIDKLLTTPEQTVDEGGAQAHAAAFAVRLQALTAKRQARSKTASGDKELQALASDAQALAKARDFQRANKLLERLEQLLAGDDSAAKRAAATAAWQAECAMAKKVLKSVASRIANARHASSKDALLEIKAVIASLGDTPSSPRQAVALQTALNADSVLHDVSELVRDIRTPLLQALDDLRAELPG